MNKIVCYHHDDLDGLTAAAVLLQKYPEAECIAVNYGDEWDPHLVGSADVYVLDFSFPDMRHLQLSCQNLTWIDHHRSAMERQQDAWDNEDIMGLRRLDYAGCELTWMYLFDWSKMPQIVKLVGDMDMWEFEYGDMTRKVCEAANYTFKYPADTRLRTLLKTDNYVSKLQGGLIDDLRANGEILLKAKSERIEKLFDRGIDTTFFGKKARLMNATSDISNLGSYVYTQDGYDLAVMYQVIGEDVILSFRSDTVDVGKIAEYFGGGGHKAASGATVSFAVLLELYKHRYDTEVI